MKPKVAWISALILAGLFAVSFDPAWTSIGTQSATIVGSSPPVRGQPSETPIQVRLADGSVVAASAMTIPGHDYANGETVVVTGFESLIFRTKTYSAQPENTSGGL